MKKWQPDIDLHNLLAALGQEIADAPDEDVRTICGQAGSPLTGIARDMRVRIAAIADSDAEQTLAPADFLPYRDVWLRSH